MKITLFDTYVCSDNLGDSIIMDSVRKHITEMFPNSMVMYTQTHEKISHSTYSIIKKSNFSFVGGTNLISSNMNFYNQWKINLIDSLFLKDIILMGVGWWMYQKNANFYTRYLLKSILNHKFLHSVRDSYTENMLKKAGFQNTVNTSCPTMWSLNEEHCQAIPISKAETVITTLTDYNQHPNYDFALIDLLKKSYKKIYFWPQGSYDVEYLNKLGVSRLVTILPAKVEAYDLILKNEVSIDFIGTRLHAGIRALQNKRRTIILALDNRSIEKAKDFNLMTCPRNDFSKLKQLIYSNFSTCIKLPSHNISKFKNQFK
jgi:polysaccharide pyruvyl transferase WcaK-like protein